jgi:hypothetical protein
VGPQGSIGPQGEVGTQGVPGAPGQQGPRGAVGSHWFVGEGLPSTDEGVAKDFYLDLKDMVMYIRHMEGWRFLGALK